MSPLDPTQTYKVNTTQGSYICTLDPKTGDFIPLGEVHQTATPILSTQDAEPSSGSKGLDNWKFAFMVTSIVLGAVAAVAGSALIALSIIQPLGIALLVAGFAVAMFAGIMYFCCRTPSEPKNPFLSHLPPPYSPPTNYLELSDPSEELVPVYPLTQAQAEERKARSAHLQALEAARTQTTGVSSERDAP